MVARDVPFVDRPRTPVLVTIILNQETHVSDPSHAADIVHALLPFAPVPIRLDRVDGPSPEFGNDWLVDLDLPTTNLVAEGNWLKITASLDDFGYVTLEIPQP